jgi:hypothetical protein
MVAAQVPHVAEVSPLAGLEQIVGIPTKHLARRLEKDPWVWNQSGNGESGVIDTVFAANQVGRDKGTVSPGKHMIVQAIHLAESGPHLSGLYEEPAGNRRKREKAFFEIHAFLAEGEEEVGASIRIDNGLERHFRFMHLERRSRVHLIGPKGSQKVTDYRDIGIECLGITD